jgi:hypothetical protein
LRTYGATLLEKIVLKIIQVFEKLDLTRFFSPCFCIKKKVPLRREIKKYGAYSKILLYNNL